MREISLRQTKICINTQTYPFREQCKGKVREAIASGVLLLEEDNKQTRAFLAEGEGVLYFRDFTELTALIEKVTKNPGFAEKVINGGRKVKERRINANAWTGSLLRLLYPE